MNVNSMMDYDFASFNPYELMDAVQQENDKKPFVIDNDKVADWALRRIADLQNDTATWKSYYKGKQKRLSETTMLVLSA